MENLVSPLQMICTQWLVVSKNETCCSGVLHGVNKQSTEYNVVANGQNIYFVLTAPLTQILFQVTGITYLLQNQSPFLR